MRRMPMIITAWVAGVSLLCGTARAVPLHPRTVKRLVEYERLHEWVWLADDASSRGVGVIPPRGPVVTPENPSAEVRILTLLVEFEDEPAAGRGRPRRFENLLFKRGDGEVMSAANYFAAGSGGALKLTGDVFGWYLLPGLSGEYAGGQAGLGKYPGNAQKLVEDALSAATDIPLERFDALGPGGDGVVDVLLVIHSGRGAELTGERDDLWSHSGMLPSPVERNGMRVERYILAPAGASLGILCHEIARVLGAPPLYDPVYAWSGLDAWSLMGTGAWAGVGGETPSGLDAYSRMHLGFTTPVDVWEDLSGATLGCGRQPPPVFRLFPKGTPGTEYFLVECRTRSRFDPRLPGEGVLIYHVDERSPDNGVPRCGPGMLHPRVALEQADGLCGLEAGRPAEAGHLWARSGTQRFPSVDFDDYSMPSSLDYRGRRTGVAVRGFRDVEGDLVADLAVNAGPDSTRAPRLRVAVEGEGGGRAAVIRVRVPRAGPLDLAVCDSGGAVVWRRELLLDRPGDYRVRWAPSLDGRASPATYFVEAKTPDWWDVTRITMP